MGLAAPAGRDGIGREGRAVGTGGVGAGVRPGQEPATRLGLRGGPIAGLDIVVVSRHRARG